MPPVFCYAPRMETVFSATRRFTRICHILNWIALVALTGCGGLGQPPADSQSETTLETTLFFQEATQSSGIDFQHWCGDGGHYFFPEVMGSGIALLDYDRDGNLDIFAVQGMSPAATPDRSAGLTPSANSRLYRQVSARQFEDVTGSAGLEDHEPYGMGVAVGDVNNDGWPDLYVSKYGDDRLWLNREGTFQDVTTAAGIDNPRWGTSCCFVDYDRDGWLDLFVVNYVDYFPSQRCAAANGNEDYCHPSRFNGSPARLFRNVSGAASVGQVVTPRFEDVSLETGVDLAVGPGLGVLPADWNADAWPDLYVANDALANFLWVNQAGQRFLDDAIPAGAAYDAAGKPQSSMGVAAGDVDGDRRRDLFMTHLDGEYSTLYLQVTTGQFEDQTAKKGLARPTIPTTGFGTALLDLDLDGDLDLVIGNGRVRRRDGIAAAEGAEFWQSYSERNQILVNDGQGSFSEIGPGKDAFLAEPHVTRGLAVGDLDNDGDLDLVTSEVNGPARIFLNVAERRGSWLSVRALELQHGQRDALGAVVTVTAGSKSWQRDVQPAFSYLSSSDPRAHFGLGKVDKYDAIEVLWPDGSRERFPAGEVNRQVTLRHGAGEAL
jgi:hypothetical protein